MKELLNKEIYLIECENFIYYPKVAHIIGFGGNYDEIYYYLDYKDFTGEDKEINELELTRFKTYEDCFKECERLNNIPSNKERAKRWNSPETQMQLAILKGVN